MIDQTNNCPYTTFTVINVVNFGAFTMANAFTPNGDGNNDHFYPVTGPNSPVVFNAFRIYNRWGQLIYDSPAAPGWDGTFGGVQQPVGTYLYFVSADYPDPNNASRTIHKSLQGNFMLLR